MAKAKKQQHSRTNGSSSKAESAVLLSPGAAAARADLDTSHASAELVSLVLSFLHDQSAGDVDTLLKHFDPDHVAVIDVVFGAVHDDVDELRDALAQIEGALKLGAKFYPTKILGDATSGVAFFTAEPAVLGRELNAVGAFNFRDELVRREVVYSDGRHFGRAAIRKAAPGRKPVKDFHESVAGEVAAPEMRRLAKRLGRALADQDSAKAASLFASDATFEDLTLHVSIFGTISIEGFFKRALHALPYGHGSSVLHVLGSAVGGGYEWASHRKVGNGIIALELDAQGLITHASAMWDGSLVSATYLKRLAGFTIEDGE
jgi:hypothetical protein